MIHGPTGVIARKSPNRFGAVRILALTHAMLFGAASFAGAQVDGRPDPKGIQPPAVTRDWPYWRGPGSFGVRTEALAATTWSPTKGIRWKVALPGLGHAAPVIVGDQVFIATADEKAQSQALIALHRETGALLWNTVFYRGRFLYKHQKNSHASATPACDGSRVFVPTVADNALWLTALNVNGDIAWQRRLGPFASEWGYASSPALYKDLVIVVGDNKGAKEAVDAAETSYLVGVKRDTGEIVWRVPRPLMASYGTPVVAHLAGRDQLLLSGAQRIVAYDPATGKELWFFSWGAFRSANSMVCGPDCVYASTTWPDNQIVCVRADGNGDVTESHLVWRHARVVTDIPSALFHDGRLYLTTDRGMAVCMDGATGKTVWQDRLGGPISSSPVLAGDVILSTDEQGTTHLFKTGMQFELVATNNLNDPVLASPALSGDRLFLRSRSHLYCVDGQTPGLPVTINIKPTPKVAPPIERPVSPTKQPAPKVVNAKPATVVSAKPATATADDGVPVWAWLVVGAFIAVAFLANCVLVGLLLKDRFLVAKETPPEPSNVIKAAAKKAPPPLLFACAACGKSLKVKADLGGKKVKCPHCGSIAPVPATKARKSQNTS